MGKVQGGPKTYQNILKSPNKLCGGVRHQKLGSRSGGVFRIFCRFFEGVPKTPRICGQILAFFKILGGGSAKIFTKFQNTPLIDPLTFGA